ncbi:hypothetical protein QE152_g19161 [Popillia japonica]|uniref:Uncharacterized protein n=1 Tax=Popillia japonica TaxID=7064 RepID=A0AAW1L339_POPJA
MVDCLAPEFGILVTSKRDNANLPQIMKILWRTSCSHYKEVWHGNSTTNTKNIRDKIKLFVSLEEFIGRSTFPYRVKPFVVPNEKSEMCL